MVKCRNLRYSKYSEMKHLEYLVTCMILNNKVLRSFLNLEKCFISDIQW